MTTQGKTRDWAEERAWEFAKKATNHAPVCRCVLCYEYHDMVFTALREAEARILSRLADPDEGLIEAVANAVWQHLAGAESEALRESGCEMTLWPAGAETTALVTARALATALSQPEQKETER